MLVNFLYTDSIFFVCFILAFFLLISYNLVKSLLFLITMYILVSYFLIFLGLDFFGFMLIIVYIGAIAMLFLFVLMMFNIPINTSKPKINMWFWIKFFCFFALCFQALKSYIFRHYIKAIRFGLFPDDTGIDFLINYRLNDIGLSLYSPNYFIFVILIGMLLLIVLIGVIFITLNIINTNKVSLEYKKYLY